ncbi:hypothetical protein BMI86_11325 [Thioclava sp. DLFJ5-1]|uniref:YbaN family protein n=1 Tax=unclassified Thioclava TaxID=2621713 RepID=UPI0009975729|nr:MULTISPECIES: YbaN family protein [unclassified Thioclava]OOY03588.1 hypothetical protein BMI87_16320 [Thioclava sp. F28-4]OOY20051.1 hypothetical protein BMI86_11325 [Thioclava sp. DLFJ5-1]
MRILWLTLGIISAGIGIIGLFLPLVPTVPLMLLATFCFARSSDRLHNWIITHPRFGPQIIDWQERRAIAKRAKIAATVSVFAAFGLSLAFRLPLEILAIQGITLLGVLIFIWTRPNS